MGGKSVIAGRLALIATCMAFFASPAMAKCYKIWDSEDRRVNTEFTFCNPPSKHETSWIGLSVQEVVKHPELSGYMTPAGDIALSVQSASVKIDMVNERGWGNDRAPHSGFRVPLSDHDRAMRLAKAVNAGETITITAANKSSGEAHTVFSGLFAMTFPAEALSLDAKKETAVPATASAPKKVEPKSYPVSKLPSELTSVTLIPFAPGQEAKWRQEYLNRITASHIDKSCEAAAYPYRRAHSYWNQVDNALETANYQAPDTLNRQSAATLCADQAASAEYRGQLLHHPQKAFDQLCALLNAPATHRDRNLLSVKAGAFETACYDLAVIRANGQEQCMRAYLPNIDEAQKGEHCNCVGEKVADYYADGSRKFNSKTSVQASSLAQNTCKNSAAAQQPVGANAAESAPQPANAAADSSKETIKEQTSDAVNKAANKIKKGLGGLFK